MCVGALLNVTILCRFYHSLDIRTDELYFFFSPGLFSFFSAADWVKRHLVTDEMLKLIDHYDVINLGQCHVTGRERPRVASVPLVASRHCGGGATIPLAASPVREVTATDWPLDGAGCDWTIHQERLD